jgi:copper resistance protein B
MKVAVALAFALAGAGNAGQAVAQRQHHDHGPSTAVGPGTSAPEAAGRESSKADEAPLAPDWPAEVSIASGSSGVTGGMDHSVHGAADPATAGATPPASPGDHAADRLFDAVEMARARSGLHAEHGGNAAISKLSIDLAEWQARDGDDLFHWEGEAWFGGDLDRLVFKTRGEAGQAGGLETAEVEALYSRAIGPYFDLQGGLRQDLEPGPRRTFGVLAVEGLAPYWVEVLGAGYLSSQGEFLGRLEASWDLRLTQRWIFQSRLEAGLAARDYDELNLGAGLTSLELGWRLRYQITPRLAPYLGLSLDRKLGETANLAPAKEGTTSGLVIGFSAWF